MRTSTNRNGVSKLRYRASFLEMIIIIKVMCENSSYLRCVSRQFCGRALLQKESFYYACDVIAVYVYAMRYTENNGCWQTALFGRMTFKYCSVDLRSKASLSLQRF